MADQKISELTALTGANVADDDAIAIVDTSATETKKIVFSELKNALDTATGFVRITGDTMTGDLNVLANVGIGTSSPEGSLHLNGSFAGRGLVIDLATEGVTDNVGTFNAKHSAGILAFQTNSTERMRIDSSGNLLVGKTTQGLTNAGFEVAPSGQASATQSGASALRLNRLSSDGEILQLRKDGSTVGSIAASGGLLVIGDSDCGIAFEDGTTNHIYPWNVAGGANNDGNISLGATGGRFKDLYLSGSAQLANITNGAGEKIILNSDNMVFQVQASEAMRIDSSGNLLVGKTASSISTVGGQINANGQIRAIASGLDPIFVNRLTSDGDIIKIAKDGNTVGSIGSRAGLVSTFILDPRSGGAGISAGGPVLYPTNESGSLTNGNMDFGAASYRWKDLYLSGGVVFGDAGGSGTSTSNTLDSYEEGTWTPNIEGSSTSGAATFTSRSGTYTKIGRQVHVTFEWVLTNHTGSGIMDIIGLPFAPAGPTGTEYTGNIMVYQMDITVDNPISLSVYASQGASRLRIYGSRDNGTWIAQNIETANTVIGSITYFA